MFLPGFTKRSLCLLVALIMVISVTPLPNIRLTNLFNNFSWSSPTALADLDIPCAPTDLLVETLADPDALELSWQNHAGDNAWFEITRYWTGADGAHTDKFGIPAGNNKFLDNTVLENITYRYQVTAITSAGTSAPSTPIVYDVLARPTNITVFSGQEPLRPIIKWMDNTLAETGFLIERTAKDQENQVIMTVPANQCKLVDYLVPNTTYTYRIKAIAENGGSLYSSVYIWSPSLSGPTNFNGLVQKGQVHLTWSDNSSTESYFLLKRDSGTEKVEIKIPADSQQYVDTRVKYGTIYNYTIAACDEKTGSRIYSTNILKIRPSTPYSDLPKTALIDVSKYIPSMAVDMRYATNKNVLKKVLYHDPNPYLRKGTADKLKIVQAELARKGYRLKIWDAYRPPEVQFKLWKFCPNPTFIINPYKEYPNHSRGTSVDVTIVDGNGKDLVMPSQHDNFTARANRNYNDVSKTAASNSRMLQSVMHKAGFYSISSEWWHFDDSQYRSYTVLKKPNPVSYYPNQVTISTIDDRTPGS